MRRSGVRAHPCHSFTVSSLLQLALAATLTFGSAIAARAQSWIPVGAPGGNVRSLATDPRDANRVYLGTAEGILYRSSDGGVRWERMNPGFPCRGCSLDEIKVDPRGIVYIGYWEVHGSGGGVARSMDGGETFTLLKGIQNESVRAVAVASSNPKVIAAGTLTGVFLSRDAGETWKRITPRGHADLRNIESLAFDPDDAQVLYAGTWHLGWKTENGGGTWSPIHRGMIDDSDVMTLTVDQRDRSAVFASACSGIYRSSDGGDSWTKMHGIPYSSRRTRAFAQGLDDPGLLLAGTTEGLFVSEDDGASWRRTTRKELVVNAVLPRPDGTILLGTEGAGVLRSKDRGRTWVTSNTGFSERFVFRVLFDEQGRRIVVAVWGPPQYAGVFVAPSVGGPWVRLGEGLSDRQVLSLAVLGGTLYAGTDDGIYARGRDAKEWSRLSVTFGGEEAHPRVTELIALGPDRLIAATASGVLRSTDRGATWSRHALSREAEVAGIAVAPDDPNRIVAVTRAGIFRTKDGGEIWDQVSGPLGADPHALAFSPDGRLFATTTGGLFRSRNQGATWKRVGGGLPQSDLTGIAIDGDGRTMYVSDFTWGGVFRSTDGGATWQRMPTDGLGSDRVWALSVDPANPGRLLAAAAAGGLHVLVSGSGAANASRGSD